MDNNIDYNALIAQQLQKNQSLSDRLDEIAKQNDAWSSQGANYIAGLPKADLADPNKAMLSTMNLKTGSLAFTKAQEEKYNAGLKMLTELLSGKTQAESQAETVRHNKATENLDYLKTGGTGSNLMVNPDGTLQATGELDDTDANLKAIMEGKILLKDLTPTDRSKISARAERLGLKMPTEKDQEGNLVSGVVKRLKDLYYGKSGSQDDLSLGTVGGLKTNIMNMFQTGNYNINASTYTENKSALVRQIMSLVGEKGIMTDVDAKRIQNLLPSTTSDPAKAQLKWDEIEAFLKQKYGQTKTSTTTSGGFTIEKVE